MQEIPQFGLIFLGEFTVDGYSGAVAGDLCIDEQIHFTPVKLLGYQVTDFKFFFPEHGRKFECKVKLLAVQAFQFNGKAPVAKLCHGFTISCHRFDHAEFV